MKRSVVIVAGGSGTRMGSDLPKQYMQLAGKPVIAHTVECFLEFDPSIHMVVVISREHRDLWEQAGKGFKEIVTVTGGESRYHSVRNGLARVPRGFVVGVHDAVRPLVSPDLLERCYRIADETGSAIPVLEVGETIRKVNESGGSDLVDRTSLRRVQTPQVFRSELLREAYDSTSHSEFTDDASVYESLHGKVSLVQGEDSNIKITRPVDLDLAGLLITLRG